MRGTADGRAALTARSSRGACDKSGNCAHRIRKGKRHATRYGTHLKEQAARFLGRGVRKGGQRAHEEPVGQHGLLGALGVPRRQVHVQAPQVTVQSAQQLRGRSAAQLAGARARVRHVQGNKGPTLSVVRVLTETTCTQTTSQPRGGPPHSAQTVVELACRKFGKLRLSKGR